MAAIKIGLTAGFILIGIPLLTRWLRPGEGVLVTASPAQDLSRGEYLMPSAVYTAQPALVQTWSQATLWVGQTSRRNLWFIVKTTVPLMLLAGLLGSALITFLPFESLAYILPRTGRLMTLLGMGAVALIGISLPVPMAFDTIVTAILLQAGLPVTYAIVLLFTLGIFSIYPFFMVWQAMGRCMAMSLLFGLAGLGIVAGVVGHRYAQWDLQRQQRVVFAAFGQASALEGPKVLRVGGGTHEVIPDHELVASLRSAALIPQPVTIATVEGITVARVALQTPVAKPGTLFSRFEGDQFGLDEPSTFSILRFIEPFAEFRGIAAGDLHNDGWIDILLTSDTGLALYANRQGQGFVRQQIDIPALKDYYVVNAALVDLNNDGWLDIFFSTYRRGNYVIYNTGGQFTKEHLVRLPNHEDAIMSAAAAFGDVNKDGNLDIVLGNYSLGPWARDRSLLSSRNVVLLHDGERFRVQPLREIHGETFSVLLSDFNNDGNLDLIVGNDHSPPDMYYIGNGDGSFQRITRDNGLIPHSTRTTMSVASADINNDLLPEIYVGQISGNSGGDRIKNWRVGPEVCREIVHPEHKKVCEEMIAVQRSISKAHTTGDVFTCLSMEVQEYRKDCMAYHLLRQAAMQNGSQELCALFPDSYEIFSFICHHLPPQEEATSRGRAPREAEDWRQEIPSILQHNVLLMPTGDGRFVDKAREMGVQIGGWTWNAKFADVDNDEFVDLYVVNGYFPSSRYESNVFYHNQQGQRFVEHTAEAGLGSFLATSSYVYIDMDNDGDLDIIAVPVVGPILVYVNNSTTGHAIDFELRDYIGNRFGIGSKIIIHYGVNGSRHQMREIQAGGGFISYDAPMAHFGLGEFAYVERVEVLWSTGERSDIHGDFAAGSRYIITRQKPMPGVSGDNVYPKRTELPPPTNFQ